MLELLEREAPPVARLTANTPQNDTLPLEGEDFETGIISHMDTLLKAARRLTNNPQDAEDLLQDVMLQALRSSHTYHRGTNLRAWLFRILKTTAINRYRKSSRQPICLFFPDDEVTSSFYETDDQREQDCQPGAEEEIISRYLDQDVDQALTTLLPIYRQVILLADIGNFTYKEIANMLHVPIGTVMSRISRGRRILQQSLLGYAQEHGYIA